MFLSALMVFPVKATKLLADSLSNTYSNTIHEILSFLIVVFVAESNPKAFIYLLFYYYLSMVIGIM
jgi:hypothetical protein